MHTYWKHYTLNTPGMEMVNAWMIQMKTKKRKKMKNNKVDISIKHINVNVECFSNGFLMENSIYFGVTFFLFLICLSHKMEDAFWIHLRCGNISIQFYSNRSDQKWWKSNSPHEKNKRVHGMKRISYVCLKKMKVPEKSDKLEEMRKEFILFPFSLIFENSNYEVLRMTCSRVSDKRILSIWMDVNST